MTLSELVVLAYERYRGKNTNVPQSGDEKYQLIVDTANQQQRQWARDPNHDWVSRFEIRTVGTLSTGTQSYEMDDDMLRVSDYVMLVSPDAQVVYRTVVSPMARTQYTQGVYVSGNPKTITFIDTIDDSLAGYSLQVPTFTLPDDMTSANDDVAADSSDWLAWATAAELARNDPARQDQFGNLSGIANDLYGQMVADNQNAGYLQPAGASYNMPVMGGLN